MGGKEKKKLFYVIYDLVRVSVSGHLFNLKIS